MPKTPNFDQEAEDAVKFDGLPPLRGKKAEKDLVVFKNVANIWVREGQEIRHVFTSGDSLKLGPSLATVIVEDAVMVCWGVGASCAQHGLISDAMVVDTEGGAVTPGLVSFGSQLGTQEIAMEISTTDGVLFDPLEKDIPNMLGGDANVVRAVDGLQYGTRDAL